MLFILPTAFLKNLHLSSQDTATNSRINKVIWVPSPVELPDTAVSHNWNKRTECEGEMDTRMLVGVLAQTARDAEVEVVRTS
jgi:hypothetical protein